ncbi:FAD-dependent oxidoreductase [Emergencia sp. 1XD21-10]|uniref:FAD-dependent oxidoreductase n=1 Tax=Emergencia sp. 1XD21-10 TaxID=2304569 RepID=UPI00137B8951|nr:FAD-dependent oxidoreductase [Emergencia sp. 1XD21-10]MCI9639827.1 FAD-dependent oxidoreductase [Emergencia sp.]NCE97788.1 FAD-dependent oxidoreductase [Emergencia sp. 1XD21-10]
MESIWTKDIKMPEFPTAEHDMKVDVLVVGGGMCGLLIGHFLNEQGANYAVVEKDTIAGGVTKNTTAKITAFHGLSYRKRLARFGREKTAAYLSANEKAIEMYRRLAVRIPCDFEEKDNYVYTMNDVGAVLSEIEAITEVGGKVSYTEHVDIPLLAACAVKVKGQAQFHPLKFASEIAKGQAIYEHSFVSDVKKQRFGWQAFVINGWGRDIRIHADKVIIATHFPFIDRRGMYFMKMYQSRSYVLALSAQNDEGKAEMQQVCGMYIGNGGEKGNPLDLSFRTYDDYLLLGGGGGRTGTSHAAFEQLRQQAKRLYPGSREVAAWAAQDCMTLDEVPYVGSYSRKKDGLLVATGFNKWGMTGAMTAAMALTGELDREIGRVFSPQRTILRPQLLVNGFETTKNFMRPTAPRCTHLGCALKWNTAEKTWDCPCHGSRFAGDGKLIDNPAQMDMKKRI